MQSLDNGFQRLLSEENIKRGRAGEPEEPEKKKVTDSQGLASAWSLESPEGWVHSHQLLLVIELQAALGEKSILFQAFLN